MYHSLSICPAKVLVKLLNHTSVATFKLHQHTFSINSPSKCKIRMNINLKEDMLELYLSLSKHILVELLYIHINVPLHVTPGIGSNYRSDRHS